MLFTEIYSLALHKALLNSVTDNSSEGIHLLCIRVTKRNSKTIEFKYISYNELSINSLLWFIIVKNKFSNTTLFKDWGDSLTIIDSSFKINDKLNLFLSNDNVYNSNEHLAEFMNINGCHIDNMIQALDFIKKTSIVSEDITKYINLIINKDYSTVFSSHYKIDIINEELENSYLLKDCIFVVKDINSVLDDLKGLGYIVSKGNKSSKYLVDSMSSFLSSYDNEYRNFLYSLAGYGVSNNFLPKEISISRSKFSFKNIHVNLGNSRHYSTVSYNRQSLFQNNYNIIK